MKHLIILLALIATPASSQQLTERAAFMALVQGKALTRMGVKLVVTDDGVITGRAFGGNVSGRWEWSAPYFCRDLAFSGKSLGYDCQVVVRSGDKLTFTAQKGKGDSARLTLD